MKILKFLPFLENIHSYPVKDIGLYNKRMDAAILDKLFFLNKLDFDVIVDFGCADGLLLEKIHDVRSDIGLIGYEIDSEELQICKSKLGNKAFVTDEWGLISEKLKKFESPALCLSSVIHEVYSYTDDESNINRFWKERVFGGDFKYIVIRDMITSNEIDSEKNFIEDVIKVKEKIDPQLVNSFEKIWGKMENSYKQFVHFLLKYKYTNNWDREVHENYLPMTISELKNKIPSSYKIMYESSFVLEYIQNQVMKDFGVKIKQPTHIKMILKNEAY